MQIRKSIPGRGNSKCKGPEAGMYLVFPRNSPEASVTASRRDGVADKSSVHFEQFKDLFFL